ncbi:MAG: TetR/AcrR family transcriptional regulator [bacterium]
MANTYGPNQARIFEEALRLLEEKGLQGLSMRNLAERLHMKAPSLYKHVEGRDEILAQIQAWGIQEFGETLRKAPKSKKAKALAYRKWARENPHLYEVTFRIPLLRDRLPLGLEEGVTQMIIQITGKDHDHARAVWALMHGLIDLEKMKRFPENADLDKTWKRAIEMVG